MLGWRSVFHVTTSLQNFYQIMLVHRNGGRARLVTHVGYLLKGTICTCPYDLYSDVPAIVFTLPHICKPSPEQCGTGSVVTYGDLHSPREKCMEATQPVKRFETLLSGPW